MPDSEYSIAVVTIPDISEYNSERVNFGICSKLVPEFDVTLIGPERVSERIETSFDTEKVVKRSYQNKWIRRVLLVPLTFHILYTHTSRENPEIVASFGNLPVNGLVSVLISRMTSTSSVVRVTSDFTNLWKYQTGLPTTVACFLKNNVLGRLAVHLADAVIVLGPVMKSKLERLGVDGSKIWAIPQPLHISNEGPESSLDVRSKLGIPQDASVLLFVGYFKKSKGPKRLIQTVEYITERDTDIHVVIVGSSGEYEDYVRENLEGYERVHFTGWVRHDTLSSYFQTADVLLHPSNTDGLPNVVLEALYHDLPVVATDSGGEIPVYVSNIGQDYRELGEMILNDDIIMDSCPEAVQDPLNRRLYQSLFQSIASD